jgi:hypothetical protein
MKTDALGASASVLSRARQTYHPKPGSKDRFCDHTLDAVGRGSQQRVARQEVLPRPAFGDQRTRPEGRDQDDRRALQEVHPPLRLSISTTTQVVDFSDAEVDCAIRTGTGLWSGLESTLLFKESLALAGIPSLLRKIGR